MTFTTECTKVFTKSCDVCDYVLITTSKYNETDHKPMIVKYTENPPKKWYSIEISDPLNGTEERYHDVCEDCYHSVKILLTAKVMKHK